MREEQVNPINLCKRILLQWRMILIFIVVGSILMNLYSILNSHSVNKEMVEVKSEKEQCESELSQREINEVQDALNTYQFYQSQYENLIEYYNTSLIMKMNANEVSTIVSEYYVDNHYQMEYPIMNSENNEYNIVKSYVNQLQSDQLYNEIGIQMKWNVEDSYIKELIEVEAVEDTSLIQIKIIANSENDCRKLAEYYHEFINEHAKDFIDVYGEYDVSFVSESYTVCRDEELSKKQLEIANDMSYLQNAYTKVTSGLNENQKKYYAVLLDDEKDINVNVADSITSKDEDAATIIYPKAILLGAIIGALVGVAFISCIYVLCGTVKEKREIEDMYNVPVLGNILITPIRKRKFGHAIDKWLYYKLYHKNINSTDKEQFEILCKRICIAIEKSEKKKILISTSSCKDEIRYICQEIENKIRTTETEVLFANILSMDLEELEYMKQVDGIILVEKTYVSKHKEIQEEMDVIKSYGTTVIGTVILD